MTKDDALRQAAAMFRDYERHHQAEADKLESSIKLLDDVARKQREAKAARNREMAEVCEAALVPAPNEPGPYGIGSDHWPGVGKVLEEMSELAGELGKLIGSGGAREHWTGDLVPRMRGEVADVRAALDFFVSANPVLTNEAHTTLDMSGARFMARRQDWKRALFQAWQQNLPAASWPDPEQYGLPPRDEQ